MRMLAPIVLALLSADWTPPVADVAAHPRIGALVFASTASGIYRSTDAGMHWQLATDAPLNTIAFVPVHALAFNPFDDHELCALGDSFVSCSTDLGATWNVFPKPGVTFLLFDPTTRDRMFMGTPYGSDWLYVSNDHGRTWSTRGALDVHPWFHGSAAIDPRSGSLLETGSPHGGCIPVCSLFRSDDGGTSWREILAAEDAWMLAIDRAGRSVLYVATGGSISASVDLGATFETRGAVPSSVTVLASDPNSAATIYAADNSGTILQSIDGGRDWRRVDHGQIHNPITHMSAGIDGTVYVATEDRIFAISPGKRRRAAAH